MFALASPFRLVKNHKPPSRAKFLLPQKPKPRLLQKGQDGGKGARVTKTEVAVPLTNREKKALDLYKKVEVVTVNAPC
jgi:hypothetical protein